MNPRDTHDKDDHLSYLLTAFAFESISEAGRLEVERHLAWCAVCRRELEEIRATVSSVRGAYAGEPAGETSTFEARKLERVLAGARSRRRGRIRWMAWPAGIAAALCFMALVASMLQVSTRDRGGPATGVAMYMAEGPAGVEDVAAVVQEAETAASPATTEGMHAPSAASRAPAPPSKLPDEVASNASRIRAPDARHLWREELQTEGVYRHRVAAYDTEGAAAEVAGAPAAAGALPPASQAAPEKPAEVAQDRWGGKTGNATDHFGAIVLGIKEQEIARLNTAVEETELKRKSPAGAAVAAGSEVQGWDFSVNSEFQELDPSAAGRGKVPIKNLPQVQDPEKKQAAALAQKADGDGLEKLREQTPDFKAPDLASKEAERDYFNKVMRFGELGKDIKELEDLTNHQLGTPDTTDPQMFAAGSRALEDSPEVSFFVKEPDGWGRSPSQRAFRLPPALADRSSRERLLRAWSHWKALDAELGLEAFEARRLEIPPPSPGGEGLPADEFLKRYGVHPFVETRLDAHSTFGMDVDTASYTIARGALASGTLPRPDQVRVEEFVNYFPEPPAAAASKEGVFAVACEGGPSLFGKGLDLLEITIRARDIAPGERKDAVLTLAVDTSGSMHHGGRLALVRDALRELVAALEPGDRVAVVGFGDHPYLVLPHTSAREAERILDALESLAPRGDTNFEAGLDLAYRVADEALEPRAVNRIILCSDGVATSGARGPEELLAKIEAYARRGIHLSTLGVGLGKYNDRLLEMLADRGNGSYAYADDQPAALEVFRKNLPGSLQVLARDAKIQVAFDPGVVTRYRLLGYENRDIADEDFRNDQVDAGEVGPGTTVTVLYEIERASGSSGDPGRIHLRYVDTGTGRVEEEDYPLPPGVIATSIEASSARLRFIACVAEMAELLRESYWARDGSFGDVLAALLALPPEDRSRPEVREVAGLVFRAQLLSMAKLEGK